MGKPVVTVAVLGDTDHGKTTLTAALSKAFSEKFGLSGPVSVREIELGSKAMVQCEAPDRIYNLVDMDTRDKWVRNLIRGSVTPDAAILVVSATVGPMVMGREMILLAHQVGIPYVTVFLNKFDQVADHEVVELIELETRELLSAYDFDGDDCTVVRGSALQALEADAGDPRQEAILELIDELDDIPTPTGKDDSPFLMAVQDVMTISGRGTVVTGEVERGSLEPGDELEIVGLGWDIKRTVVSTVQRGREQLARAAAGDFIGALLTNVTREDVQRGQVLVWPGTLTAHAHFQARLYVLTPEEGGHRTPMLDGVYQEFYFRTTDVRGILHFPEGTSVVLPGDDVASEIELTTPVAMEQGTRFAVRESGRTVAIGVVFRTLDGETGTAVKPPASERRRRRAKPAEKAKAAAEPRTEQTVSKPAGPKEETMKEPPQKAAEPAAAETKKAAAPAEQTPLKKKRRSNEEIAFDAYEKGDDYFLDKKYEKALECYQKAAKYGHPEAMDILGTMYYLGQGVKTDYKEAANWYKQAAELGIAESQHQLAYFYSNGMGGLEENQKKAVYWYTKAAKQGYSRAQYELGYHYHHGKGVKRNIKEAKAWYQKAADKGNEDAKKALKRIKWPWFRF